MLGPALETWAEGFKEQTRFSVGEPKIKGPPRFAYLEIRNVKQDEITGLEDVLSDVSLKSLQLTAEQLAILEQPPGTPTQNAQGDDAVPAASRVSTNESVAYSVSAATLKRQGSSSMGLQFGGKKARLETRLEENESD